MRSPSANAQPTLGFPSKTTAALFLDGLGLSQATIATAIRSTADSVHTMLRNGRARPEAAQEFRAVMLPAAVLDRLAPAAARRGLHPDELARRLLEQVIDDGLIDAVMDDG